VLAFYDLWVVWGRLEEYFLLDCWWSWVLEEDHNAAVNTG